MYDLAVVGAGIVGLGAAYSAVKENKKVIVIEKTSKIIGSSIQNFGHAGIGLQADAARLHALKTREIWLELAQKTGIWVRESGSLTLLQDELERSIAHELVKTSRSDVSLIERIQLENYLSVPSDEKILGALHFSEDLQINPREAAPAIASYLSKIGVDFLWHTNVSSVSSNKVKTNRGKIKAKKIIIATNYQLSDLEPELAEKVNLRQCGLEMVRIQIQEEFQLRTPITTGLSALRYGAFKNLEGLAELKQKYLTIDSKLIEADVNQMYTQLPDGSVLVGDTHTYDKSLNVFQKEEYFDLLLNQTVNLFGIKPDGYKIIERWQGRYAKTDNDFVMKEVDNGVFVLVVGTGIGMTCGLGLADYLVSNF